MNWWWYGSVGTRHLHRTLVAIRMRSQCHIHCDWNLILLLSNAKIHVHTMDAWCAFFFFLCSSIAKLHFHEHKFGHKNWWKCGKNWLCVHDNLWKWLSMVYFYSHIKWMVSISGDEMRIYHSHFCESRSNCDFASAHKSQCDRSHEFSIRVRANTNGNIIFL